MARPPDARPAVARGADLAVAAAAGGAVLAAEFAVVRVAAPWFGQSSAVWANAVGVVLAALALGNALGGRWAARDPEGRGLPWALAAAALWLAAASRLGAPLCAWLAPTDAAGDRPLLMGLWGSLFATLAAAGPPAALLGAASPVLVARAAAAHGAGRAAGWVGAWGTLGSLAACALVPLVLVPAVGARGTLAVAASVVAVAGVAAHLARPRGRIERAGDGVPRVGAAGARGRIVARAGTAAALVGAAVTVVEFAAARALAPRFGSGNPVWAAIVAVVLGAVALGNGTGGFLAGRIPVRGGRVLLALGGALLALPGFAYGPLAGLFAPSADHLLAGGAWVRGVPQGAAAAAAALFGVPLAVAATASPALVRGLVGGRGAGRAAGLVFAAGTVGSVVGVYATPLALLPSLGTGATILVAGACVVAAAALWPEGAPEAAGSTPAPAARNANPRAAGAIASTVAVAAAALAFALPQGPLRLDAGQLEEIETGYQTVRVVESSEPVLRPGPYPLYGEGERVPSRFLRFDEDAASYQSVRLLRDEATLLTGGRYYDHLALGAWFDGMPWTRHGGGAPQVLVVGWCGGTVRRVLDLCAPPDGPPARAFGIEIDAAVTDLADRRLGGDAVQPGVGGAATLWLGVDGRVMVEALSPEPRFDLVVVDAYTRTQYVPFHLATVEFLRACGRRLRPSGAIGVNVHAEGSVRGAFVRAVASTMEAALGPAGGVWLVPNPLYPGNVVVWGIPSGRPPRVAAGVPPALAGPAFALERLAARHREPGLVMTDDRAPVERLAEEDAEGSRTP